MSNIQVLNGNASSTITSLELVKQINVFRNQEGKSELRHDNLLALIRDEFEEEISLLKIKECVFKNERGREYPMFILNFNQAKQVLSRESKLVRKAIFEYLNSISKEIESKGYHSTDGKIRLTTNENYFLEKTVKEFQYIDNIKYEMKLAINNLAKKFNGSYPKAHLHYNQLANYDLKEIDKDYSEYCMIKNIKELKSLDKFNKTFLTKPSLFINCYLTAISINYELPCLHLIPAMAEFIHKRDINICKDDTTIALHSTFDNSNIKLELKSKINILSLD